MIIIIIITKYEKYLKNIVYWGMYCSVEVVCFDCYFLVVENKYNSKLLNAYFYPKLLVLV